MGKVRNTNVEALRLFLMIGIFCWHILMHGFGFKNVGIFGGGNYNPLIAIGMSAVLSPATYCFMFISGYYGMRFSFKKLLNMELWLVMVALLTCMLSFLIFHQFNVARLIHAVFPVSTGFWWFMTPYVLIYIISPLLNKGIESLSSKQFGYILLFLIMFEVFSNLTLQRNGGSNFLGLFTMFLLGRFCKTSNYKMGKKLSIFLFGTCAVCLAALLEIAYTIYPKFTFIMLNYNNPLIMIMAVNLFYFVTDLKPHYSNQVNGALRPVLFIYLITDGIYVPLYEALAIGLEKNPLAYIGICLCVLLSCLAIGHVIMRVTTRMVAGLLQLSPMVKMQNYIDE